jgi:hypothetical protein
MAGENNCVELSIRGRNIAIRDSTNIGQELEFPISAWRTFLAGVRDGEFDLSSQTTQPDAK